MWIADAQNSRLFELARMFVRFDHVARFIINANGSAMSSTADASRIRSRF
jgi:hypothetical protein